MKKKKEEEEEYVAKEKRKLCTHKSMNEEVQ